MTPAPSEVVLLSTVGVSVPSTEEAVEEEAVTETVWTSVRSTSAMAKEPESVSDPVPSLASRSASSVTAPVTSVAAETVGASLVPVMVMITVLMSFRGVCALSSTFTV